MVNLNDFGGNGDGVTDNHAAFVAAITAAQLDPDKTVHLSPGVYLVSAAGFACIDLADGINLEGPLATIKMAPNMGASVRLIYAHGNQTLAGFNLDGNKTNQSGPDEHKAGVFVVGPNVELSSLAAYNFTGDGFYSYANSNSLLVTNCVAHNNDRNGITFGGGTTGSKVSNCHFYSNIVQQFDSEGGSVNNMVIEDCIIEQGFGDYVLTISGFNGATHSNKWTVINCSINGPINVVWADNVLIKNCTGSFSGAKPAVTIWRSNSQVEVTGCDFTITPTADNAAVIYIAGTGVGSVSSGVHIHGNEFRVIGNGKTFGVEATGANDVWIYNNRIIGAGIAAPGYAGVFFRSTIIGQDFKAGIIKDNFIQDFGGLGVTIGGNGTAVFSKLLVQGNNFADYTNTMTAALSLDDGTGCVVDCKQANNIIFGGCTTLIKRAPVGVHSDWGSGDSWVK